MSGSIRPSPALVIATLIAFAAGACARERVAPPPTVVVDDFGDSVRLDSAARRIVSLNPVTTELLFALGAGDRLVGRTRWDQFPSAAREVPDLGDGMGPNVEAVLGQRPDLVVLYATPANRAAAAQLRRAGVMTVSIRTDRIADFARVTTILARLVGDSATGALVVDTVMASLAEVRARADTTGAPVAFWHVWEAPLLTIGGGSFLGELLLTAGIRNAFGDAAAPSPQVSLEEVARRDPDVILAGPLAARRLRSRPNWAALRAVREGRVLVPDTMLVGRPGVRMGEAARHLRALIVGDTVR